MSQRLEIKFQTEIQRKVFYYEELLQKKKNEIQQFKIQVAQILQTLIELKKKYNDN